jgi:hypothetical protein
VRNFHSCRCNQQEFEKLKESIGRDGSENMSMQPTLYIVLHLLQITSVYYAQTFFETSCHRNLKDLLDYEYEYFSIGGLNRYAKLLFLSEVLRYRTTIGTLFR